MHVKSYRYVPKRWMMLTGLLLCLGATIMGIVVAIKLPVPPYAALDDVLIRRWVPVLFFALLTLFFAVPAYRSFLGTRMLLDTDRILIPLGASLRERIEIPYADIVGLEVIKSPMPNNDPGYLVYLVIDYRVGVARHQCSLARSYFRSIGTFRSMCTCLAGNVRACNPDIATDPAAIRLQPHARGA